MSTRGPSAGWGGPRWELSIDAPRSRRCGKWTHAGQGLLNQRQARSAQRLYTRPKDGQGPEKIFTRDGAALASRLRAAASFRPGDTFEAQGRNS